MSLKQSKINYQLDSPQFPKERIPSQYRVTLRVENVVASAKVSEIFNLQLLLDRYKDVEKKSNFPGVLVKLRNPKSTILIFNSGKLVITGVKTVAHIPITLEKVCNKLIQAGIAVQAHPEYKIENIVVRGDFHQPINLDLASLILKSTIYEPEVFPGIIYRLTEPKICFLIFTSGRIICTGANDEDVIKKAVKNLGLDFKQNGIFTEIDNSKKLKEKNSEDLI